MGTKTRFVELIEIQKRIQTTKLDTFQVTLRKDSFDYLFKVQVLKEQGLLKFRFSQLKAANEDLPRKEKISLSKKERDGIIQQLKCTYDQESDQTFEPYPFQLYFKREDEPDMRILPLAQFHKLLDSAKLTNWKNQIERLILSGVMYRIGQYIICSEKSYHYLGSKD